jgi:nucleoside-diphosphate-sugar epimerase
LIAGDITRRQSVRAAMDGADMVVHNAGQYEYGVDKAGKQRMETTNVMGTDNVLIQTSNIVSSMFDVNVKAWNAF